MPIFLFTDIEGSTKKWEQHPDIMKDCLIKHDKIIRSQVEDCGGRVIKHTGDGIFAVFENGEPLECAVKIQQKMATEDWGEINELRVRIGLHAGHAEQRGEDYFGPVINRTARVMSAAWGGQIILTPHVKNTAKVPPKASLEDIGIHLLKDLGEPQPLYQLVHPDLPFKDFPAIRSLSARPHNLPIQATPFLGREEELTELTKLLSDPACRLLTLIGPGGIGKTRLAIQSAAENIERFAHGVYFIPLEPLTSMDFLISTLANALKFSFYSQKDQKQQLLDYLRQREILLIFDNFEHLVEGANIISEVLSAAPKIKIMVTSRELLNLRGEWIFQIKGLDVPDGERIDIEGYSAVQLFFYNARRVNTKFSLTDEDRQYVIRISQLVGGLPLGIELASAWLRTLSCKEIAQEIEKNIDFLATNLRDIPERHRSLRAVFEYSWNLLSVSEQECLQKLAIFHSGFDRNAAENIASATLSTLSSLVDKSLLRRSSSGRYEMQEILRQYALQKLGENRGEKGNIEKQHSEYYCDFLEQKEEAITELEKADAINDVRIETNNIRLAWHTAIQNSNIDMIKKAIPTFAAFYDIQGWYKEGEKELHRALDVISKNVDDKNTSILYNQAQARYASFCYRLALFDKANEFLTRSLENLRRMDARKEIGYVVNCLGNMNNVLGNYEIAEQYYEEGLTISKELNSKRSMVGSLNNLGVIYYNQRQYDKARELYDESYKVSQQFGYEKGIAMAIANKGLISHALGDYDEAKDMLLKSLEMDREQGTRVGIANSLHNLGLIYKDMGAYDKAKEYYEESLAIRRDIGDRMGISVSLNNLGILADRMGDAARAKKYHDESLELRRELGDLLGQAMSLLNLVTIFLNAQDLKKAKKHIQEAIEIARKFKSADLILEILFSASEYFNLSNNKEMSLEILTFLNDFDTDDKDILARAGSFLIKIKSQVSDELINKVKSRAKAMTMDKLVDIILYELKEI